MRTYALILLSLLTGVHCSLAQSTIILDTLTPIATATITKAERVSIDRQGYLYIADSTGSITKYDSSAKAVQVYQAKLIIRPDLLEAWNGLNVFAFYRQQKVLYLDRFLTGEEPIDLTIPTNSFAGMAAPAQDGRTWIWDLSDFSLKKIDRTSGVLLFSNPLSQVIRRRIEVTFLREYENRLYLLDSSGQIEIFDNGGAYLQSLRQDNGELWKSGSYFSFSGNDIVTLKGDSISKMNLYSGLATVISSPSFTNGTFALLTPKHLYLVERRKLRIFRRVGF
jgi:hypothetical protein